MINNEDKTYEIIHRYILVYEKGNFSIKQSFSYFAFGLCIFEPMWFIMFGPYLFCWDKQ